jgi:hypothetical protein
MGQQVLNAWAGESGAGQGDALGCFINTSIFNALAVQATGYQLLAIYTKGFQNLPITTTPSE